MGRLFAHLWWIALIALTGASPAFAQTDRDILLVRTEIVAQCRVQAGDLDLGLYNPARASRAISSIELQCTPGVVARIGLSGGQAGDPMERAMPAERPLRYQLYKDAAHTQVFGDRNIFQMRVVRATGLPQHVLVHGFAPAGQAAAEGTYLDVVVATVTY